MLHKEHIIRMPVSRDSFYDMFYCRRNSAQIFNIIFAFCAIIAGIIIGLSYLKNKAHSSTPFFLFIELIFILYGFYCFFRLISKFLFDEHLIIDRDTITHRGSRLEEYPKSVFLLKDLKSILWINEKLPSGAITEKLFFIDIDGQSHVLVKEHIGLGIGKRWWHDFLKELSHKTGLPIQKEAYVWSNDLKDKTKTSESSDKWKFLPQTSKIVFSRKSKS